MKEVNAEAMAEILEGFGIHTDKYAEIAEEFSHHLECMRDSYMEGHVNRNPRCAECEKKDARIARLESENSEHLREARDWRKNAYRHLDTIEKVHNNPGNADEIIRNEGYEYR